MKKPLLLIIPAVILLIPAMLLATLNSEAGSRFLLRRVLAALPAETSLKQVDGSLLDDITLSQLHFQNAELSLDIDRLHLAWHPAQLFGGQLNIADFSAERIKIVQHASQSQQQSQPFDVNSPLTLPLQLILQNLEIRDLHYQNADSNFALQQLKLSALTEQDQLRLTRLVLKAQPIELQADGALTLGQGFPFQLQSHWQVDSSEYGHWQAETGIAGDLQKLTIDSRQSSPFGLNLQGEVKNLQSQPSLKLRGDWQDLSWPLAATEAQFSSRQGHFEIDGTAEDYRIKLTGPLTQADLPDAEINLIAQGGSQAIAVEQLQIASAAGGFRLSGQANWADGTRFNVDLQGQNFNPGLFVTELPGKLNFASHIQGRIAGDQRQIQADIGQLDGRLRDQTIQGQGRLSVENEHISIEQLKLQSGRNRIAANGPLSPEASDCRFDIDLPHLAGLWPELAGSLQGSGHIQGSWQTPYVKLQAQGKALKFADHSAAKLKLALDFQGPAEQTAHFSLKANQIQSGGQSLDSLTLNADGNPKQHDIRLDLQSAIIGLNTAISGKLDGEHWQGSLNKLDFQQPIAGQWRLRKAAALQADLQPGGVNFQLQQSCLINQTAKLCLAADYLANGDFQAQLAATDIPAESLLLDLSQSLRIAGQLSANANFSRRQDQLTGQYRINMPAPSTLSYQDADIRQELVLGALNIQGSLQNQLLSADADLALTADDYLRARLKLDNGKAQTVSGQIKASIENLALIDALMPQISGLQGRLESDLAVSGSLTDPHINGSAWLKQASADIKPLGISISHTELQISGGDTGRLEITGSSQSGQGQLTLKGNAGLDGSLDMTLQGSDFQIARLPEAEIDASPDLQIKLADGNGKISGGLNIPKAVIKLAELPENAVTVSEDEVIVGESKPQKKAAAPTNIDADINITLGKQVKFSGFGLKTNLAGRLNVVKDGSQTALHGTLDMVKGIYKSYGQDLTLRKGRFLFSGPLDAPWLDIEASRLSKQGDVTAVLSLTGPLKSAKTRIYAEPSQPESDALAYLITGSPLNQVGKADGNLVASAALSYGVGQLSWVKDKLGVDEFEIKQGKTLQDTLLTVGQYLTSDFYVGTKLSIFNQQAILILKQKFGKSFSVETQSGASQRIKLNYELDTD